MFKTFELRICEEVVETAVHDGRACAASIEASRNMCAMTTTPTDAHLARAYYDILLNHAREQPGRAIRYKEVLELAKSTHPLDETVQSAIPVSMGRRLDLIARFVNEHHLPPLTCLAVNEANKPGTGYRPVNGSWQADMDAVADYDWSSWQGKWDSHLDAIRKAATPLKRRKEAEARTLVHEAFVAGQIPRLTQEVKEQLVELLRDGLDVSDAMAELAETRR